MADLSFTTIEEPARKALGISRDEYAICNYIETWSAYPNNRRPGFCDRTRGQMAEFIGITPRGVMKMLDKMERIGLIERYSETLFLHRITQHWFETVKLAKSIRKEEQSSPERGTKFSLKEEQSSPLKRNKVLPHKEYYKESNKEGKGNAQNAFSPPFAHVGSIEIPETNIPLEAEKKENDFAGAGPGAEFIVTTITPQAPYIRIAERVEIPETPGPKSPTVTPGRRSQAAPTIHPENIAVFDHFSEPEKCRMLWGEWIEYKWGQHRDKYKTAKSELVMLRKLYTWSHGETEIVSQIIEKSVGSLYKGLFDPNEKGNGATQKRLDLNHAQRQHLALAQYVAQRRIDAENRNAME